MFDIKLIGRNYALVDAYKNLVQELHYEFGRGAVFIKLDADYLFGISNFFRARLEPQRADQDAASCASVDDAISKTAELLLVLLAFCVPPALDDYKTFPADQDAFGVNPPRSSGS